MAGGEASANLAEMGHARWEGALRPASFCTLIKHLVAMLHFRYPPVHAFMPSSQPLCNIALKKFIQPSPHALTCHFSLSCSTSSTAHSRSCRASSAAGAAASASADTAASAGAGTAASLGSGGTGGVVRPADTVACTCIALNSAAAAGVVAGAFVTPNAFMLFASAAAPP